MLKVQLLDEHGTTLGSFDSLRKAAQAIDTNHIKLSRYAKSIDVVYSDFLGVNLDIRVEGVTKLGKVIHPSAKIYESMTHNIDMQKESIYAISEDGYIFGQYVSMYAAAIAHSLTNFRQIRRYIGQNKLVKTGLGKFY